MKKASFARIQPLRWVTMLGRSLFLVLVACFLGGLHTVQAQEYTGTLLHPLGAGVNKPSVHKHKIATCDGAKLLYTDDNFHDVGLYNDNFARKDTLEICPQDKWHRVTVTFSKFDIENGDTLKVFQGNLASIKAATATIDTIAYQKATGSGVSLAYGAWVSADCDPAKNDSGCLTFVFKTDGSNSKGTGWEAWVTCTNQSIDLRAPVIKSVKLDCSYLSGDAAKKATGMIKFPFPVIRNTGCDINIKDPGTFNLVIKNQGGKECFNSADSTSYTATNADVFFEGEFAIGIYTAEYILRADKRKTTGPTIFSVQAPSLTCNDAINVPFGSACLIQLQPDDLLENTCDTSELMQYDITISFGSGRNKKVLKTVFAPSTGTGASGGGAAVAGGGGLGVTYPMLTSEILKEAGVSLCGGTAEVSIERVIYGNVDLNTYAGCNSGIQKDKCTTILQFSDQSAPIVQLKADIDTLVACNEVDVKSLLKSYIIDNCDKDADVSFHVEFEETDDCFGRRGSIDTTTATVIYKAVDQCGNTSTTKKAFTFIRPSLKVNPNIFTIPASLEFQCDQEGTNRSVPSVKVGYIKNGKFVKTSTLKLSTTDYVCGYILTKRIEQIPITNCGKREIHEWSVIDWCDSSSGHTVIGSQFIEYIDTLAPYFVLETVAPVEVTLDHFECTYNVGGFSTPQAYDNCTSPTVFLDSIFRIQDGKPIGLDKQYWSALDCDTFLLKWIAEDGCLSQEKADTAYQLAIIKDVTSPSAVTTDELIVSIPNDWGAVIHIKDIDAGSYDACGIETREIRRDDEPNGWGETITVGCEDIGKEVRIHLRVTDFKGNSNTAWMIIRTEDRIAAVCSDLPTLTLDCAQMHGGTEIAPNTDIDGDGKFEETEWVTLTGNLLTSFQNEFGTFECSDNVSCTKTFDGENSEEQYQLISLQCGQVEIRRRFHLKDSGIHANIGISNNTWNHQIISVESKGDWKVILPADVIGTCHQDISQVTPPIIESNSCDVIAWEVEDRVFAVPGDACVKIERTYHVINWCKYSPGDPQQRMLRNQNQQGVVTDLREVFVNPDKDIDLGYFTYMQVLKIQDNEAPVVTVQNPTDACIYGQDFDALPYGEEDVSPGVAPFECDEEKTWTASATDCSSAETITWVGRLYDSFGTLIKEVNTNVLTAVVSSKGIYNAEFWASDGCGNSGGATSEPMEFWDCKEPIPYLLNGVAISISSQGTADFWATDVDRGSFDNCSDQSKLQFYIFDPLGDVTQPTNKEEVLALSNVIKYNCTRLGNQVITIYVVDEEGNYAFASTSINIQDNTNFCQSILGEEEFSFIAGAITTTDGEQMEEVDISVNGGMTSMTTGTDGAYVFSLAQKQDYRVTPHKNANPLNGVSTFDLVLISKHILGIEKLESPYKQIAADVNKSGSITAYDMVQLRQLILNVTSDFPNNESWRFVDATFEFSDTPLSDNFNEFMSINNLEQDKMHNDFIAVKVGDINENAIPNSLVSSEVRTAQETMKLLVSDRYVNAGEAIKVDFTTNQLTTIQGYQFTMEFEELELMDIEEGIAKTEHFNTNLRRALTTSWNKTNFTSTDNKLFSLQFIATASGQLSDLLQLSSYHTAIEAYDETGKVMDMALVYKTPNTIPAGFELKQNTPNPFYGTTNIGFSLPQAGEATLKIVNVQGKVLQVISANYPKGYHEITLNAKELGTTGLVYYRLEMADHVATKKMIIIE